MSALNLSRRERQILDVLYRLGNASAGDVQQALPDAPTYSTVRALLRIMVEKELVSYEDDGTRYVYAPRQPRLTAAAAALRQVVQTFFGGSAEKAVATLLSADEVSLTQEELERLSRLIEAAQQRDNLIDNPVVDVGSAPQDSRLLPDQKQPEQEPLEQKPSEGESIQ